MSEEVAERTQAPTSRRRQEARRDGVVARSPDFSGAIVVLTAMIMLAICGGKIFTTLQSAVAQSLSSSDISGREMIYSALKAIAPVVIVIFIACIAAQILQVGFYSMPRVFAPASAARKKMFQANRLPNGIVNILKIVAIALLAWLLLKSRIDRISMLQDLPLAEISAVACSMIYSIAIRLALCLLVIGALDFAYRKYRLEKQLKMTPRKAKYEQRLTEGDPKVKARRRQLAMKLVKRES